MVDLRWTYCLSREEEPRGSAKGIGEKGPHRSSLTDRVFHCVFKGKGRLYRESFNKAGGIFLGDFIP